jgi:hypothetical protein
MELFLNNSTHLLWEYDMKKFNFDKSYKIVIERVLQRGDLQQWRAVFHFYGKEKMIETIDWSAQLEQRDKHFSRLFIKSDLLNAT